MKKVIIAMVCVTGFLWAANHVQAALLEQYDTYYVGAILDGVPSNPEDELSYIEKLIAYPINPENTYLKNGTESYNRYNSELTTIQLHLITGYFLYNKDESHSGTWAVDIDRPFYVLGKYDGKNAGSLVWFINESFESINLQDTFMGKGLSHYSIYASPVPIPASLLLFGSGLIGLAGIARRKRRA